MTFDVGVDSLRDVLDRIEGATEVEAALSGNRVTLTATDGSNLTLDDGGTGLFDALNVDTGTFQRTFGSGGPDRRRTLEATREVVTELDALMQLASQSGAPRALIDLRDSIEELFREATGESSRDRLRTRFGIDLDFRSQADEVVSLRSQGRALERALAKDRQGVVAFLGADDRDGLLNKLVERLEDDEAFRSEGRTAGVLLRRTA